MAARKRNFHKEEEKQKIRASQLLNRLYDNAMADTEFMTAAQISAANSVVDRYIPKLRQSDNNVNLQGAVDVTMRFKFE